MTRIIKRCIVFLLVGVLANPIMSVHAAENETYGESEENSSVQTELEQSAEDLENEKKNDKEDEDTTKEDVFLQSNDVEGLGEEETGEQEPEETNKNNEIEQRVNYIYVEKPYLETPETERIVVSWGDGTEAIERMALNVQNEIGVEETWELEKNVDNLFLFERLFSTLEEQGIYKVTSLLVTVGEVTEMFTMEELEMEAVFGVNEEYSGIEQLKPLDDEQVIENNEVEAVVATIAEDGTVEEQDNIAAALERASEEVLASEPSMMSLERESGKEARAPGEIVVALDPGHDSTHAGASRNGLNEEVLTLKIANYCKEELEKYSGVRVYMTRTSAACPYPGTGSSGADIAKRAEAAAQAGARIYVSFHLNTSASSRASGAEVIVPNNNWNAQVGTEGRVLAQSILNELEKLGLNNRGLYSKDTTVNERYPDGSLSDYFAVQIYNKGHGIPGIIVEHAFLSNAGDVNSFLSTEVGLKKLGVADATGIAKYLGLTKIGNKVSIPEGTYIVESALENNKVLSIPNSSMNESEIVVIDEKNGGSSQRFEVHSTGDGYYNIVAEHSGKAIGLEGGTGQAGELVKQNTLKNSDATQKWSFVDAGNGYYYLYSALGTCLDVHSGLSAAGTPVWGYTFNGSNAQRWKLIQSEYKPVDDGTYKISSTVDSSKVLNIANSSIDNFANAQLDSDSELSSQRFEVTYVGKGYYKILTEYSGKSLDILNGSKNAGANLQQYLWNGSNAQLWKFVDAGDGKYYIRSKCGTVIDLASKDGAAGSNVYMWNMTGDISQKWCLKPTENRPVENGEYVITSKLSNCQALTENNGNIQLETYNNSEKQKVKVEYVGGGFYKIVFRTTGKSLDVYGASQEAGANLWQYSWNGSAAQLWKFIDAGDGSYFIKSKIGTVIDLTSGSVISGTNIQMYTMNETNAQKWVLDKEKVVMTDRPIEDGTYSIVSATDKKQVLDVVSASEQNSANVQTYLKNGTSAQNFEIRYVGEGYYKILAEHSGKAIDVQNGAKYAGANIQQYSWNGSAAQLWKFIDAGEGKFFILSQDGVVIDLNQEKAKSGTNVQTGIMADKNSQKWMFEEVADSSVKEAVYSIRAAASNNYALDVLNGSMHNKANVHLYQYNATNAQKFQITHVEKQYYKIQAQHSQKVLEVDAKTGNVRQNEWKNTETQLWKFVKNNDGSYYIKSKTGTTLDIYGGLISLGTNVQTYTMNGTIAQKWTLKEEKEYKVVEVEEGIYTVKSALNSSRVLDVVSASTANGANVQIYSSNGTDAQRFKITPVSDGYYKIICENSGKVLDILNGSMNPGTNVQQYSWNGSAAQLWRFLDAGNGEYYIQSKVGTVLDVSGANPAAGTNVNAYILNETKAQRWTIESNETKLYRIMGRTDVTVSQMVEFYNDRASVVYPYKNSDAPTIDDFCRMYIEECETEGVKAEVAFCQAMLETGFLKFGGDVNANQYNFAGLGATGNGAHGESFSSVRIGIRAQVQHLKAYASTEKLVNPLVDKRFNYVKRGSAEYVQWLGIQENPNHCGWATGKNYGFNIVKMYIIPLKTY